MTMQSITPHECSRIAQDLQIRKVQVESVVQLLDEGNTVPFITRYRKERTGGLNEDVIRQIQVRVTFLRNLHDRKQTILKTIQSQGKLTDELRDAIIKADTTKRLEDLYLPYKPKKRSLATTARERGLEPLALAVWHSDPAADNIDDVLPGLVNPEKNLASVDDVRLGVQHILAEMIAETAAVRAASRMVLWETGKITSIKNEKLPEGQGLEYKDYFEFSEPARHIPAHRILALNRGEKEGAVKVRLEYDHAAVGGHALPLLAEHLLTQLGKMPAIQPPAPEAAPAPTDSAAPSEETPPGAESPENQPAAEMASPAESAPEAPSAMEATSPDAAPAPEPNAEQPSPDQPSPQPIAEEHAASGSSETPPPADAGLVPAAPPIEMKGEPLFADLPFKSPHTEFLRTAFEDALQRLLLPSLEREIRGELTDEAEGHAAAVFARNLRSLLLQPPLHGRRILAIDPGFRTGCKLAVLDEYGTLIEHTVIHPFTPVKKSRERKPRNVEQPAAAAPQAATATVEAPPEVPAPESAPEASHDAPPIEAAPEITPQPGPDGPAGPEGPNGETPAEAAPTPEPEPRSESQVAESTEPTSESASPEASIPAEPEPEAASTPDAVEPPAEKHAPTTDRRAEAKAKLIELIKKHDIHVIALGNGTGCRETEEIVAEVIGDGMPEVSYVIVNEAGASVYSVSPVGREEFPDFDATTRGTVSIGRRLQDPLAELVKVEPQHIGVGLYQHDLGRKELKESLDAVVESCVNQVGVNVNVASIPLLRHVSGLNQMVAREIVEYRKVHGPFQSRDALQQVSGLGPQRFVQAAGFLKIPQGPNPLDRTWIHPESYEIAEKILAEMGFQPSVLDDKSALEGLREKLNTLSLEDLARRLDVGVPTVDDILMALARPGLDPREELPPPIFKKGILKVEDLQSGMELKGTVLNVVDFGAFVDIGLKDSGLVHISQMANRYIKSPYDVVAVNDVVSVWVLAVDKERNRVSLTMIQPGTERRPPERKPAPPRGERSEGGGRPPRGRGRGRQPVGAAPAGEPGQGGAPQGQGGQGQGQGQGGQSQGGRPPRGRHGGGQGRGPGQGGRSGPGGEGGEQSRPPETRPAPPPRRPRREPPRPKLSQDALEGKVPLRTFGELSALFAAKVPTKNDPRDKPAPEPPRAEDAPPPEAKPQEETPPPPAPEQ